MRTWYRYIPSIIFFLLFLIPFYWFRAGVVDLGGDSSRLYFYDPLSYLVHQSLYSITSSGTGGEAISYYSIPYITLIYLVKLVLRSPSFVIAFFHGIALSLAFLFCYLSIRELLEEKAKETYNSIIAAAVASLLYVFSPFLIYGWDKVILTHNQFFLNPLVFWLFLKFCLQKDHRYMIVLLLTTFLFSPNFSYVAAPPFFAFYPLAFLFILVYSYFIRNKKMPVLPFLGYGIIFFLLHSFHLVPQLSGLFSAGSGVNASVFSDEAKFSRGLSYFLGIAPSIKVSLNLMNLPQMMQLNIFSPLFIIFPFTIILGFIYNKTKTYVLTGIVFIIATFFASANITSIGLFIYKSLFSVPGFSMFRNFNGQWSYLFCFFYVLLLGQALVILGRTWNKKYFQAISLVIFLLLTINAIGFIKGDLLNKYHYQSKNIPMLFTIDPEYEKVLKYFRNTPLDGKVLSFPLTGPGYQMIKGKDGGAYQGPSTITYLTGKNDFTGFAGLGQFGEVFVQAVRNRDYEALNRIFAMLNIGYLFHNEDPYIYDTNFPIYPYDYVRDFMPQTQDEYKNFISKLPFTLDKKIGTSYSIYKINHDRFLPHIFAASGIIYTDNTFLAHFILNQNTDLQAITVGSANYKSGNQILFEASNSSPTLDLTNNYHLHVHDPFISRRLNDALYPFVSLREKYTLREKKSNPDDYLDYNLLFLSKRVAELALDTKLNPIPVTRSTWQQPGDFTIWPTGKYNSWEAGLTRYREQALALIDWIPMSGKSISAQNAMKMKIKENFDQHELKLLRILTTTPKTAHEKEYLKKNIENQFNTLYSTLSLKPYNPHILTYSYSVPTNTAGDYEVFVRTLNESLGDIRQLFIEYKGNNIAAQNTTRNIIRFSNTLLKPGENVFTLHYLPKNLVADTTWQNSGESENVENITRINFGDGLTENGGLIREISAWQPNKQYVITFDYNTDGKDIFFKFFDKRFEKDEHVYTNNVFFEKRLHSTTWKTHQSLLTSHPDSIGGYLQLIGANQGNSTITIRNLTVYQIPNPTMIFRKNVEVAKQETPLISSRKIDPTRYSVHVENAKYPYTLVFSEQFSPEWKIYNGGKELPISATQVVANGYANAWTITPSNVNSQSTYDITIEYAPQRSFYYLLGLSITMFIGLLIYLVISFIRK